MDIEIQCQRCGACCRWPGEVRLRAGEGARIAALIGVSEQQFIEDYTRLRHDRRGLALKERPDHACIFLQGNGCAVQAAKPAQCLEFPTRWLNLLRGKASLETMRREYPMLFVCSAFQAFLQRQDPKLIPAWAGERMAEMTDEPKV